MSPSHGCYSSHVTKSRVLQQSCHQVVSVIAAMLPSRECQHAVMSWMLAVMLQSRGYHCSHVMKSSVQLQSRHQVVGAMSVMSPSHAMSLSRGCYSSRVTKSWVLQQSCHQVVGASSHVTDSLVLAVVSPIHNKQYSVYTGLYIITFYSCKEINSVF